MTGRTGEPGSQLSSEMRCWERLMLRACGSQKLKCVDVKTSNTTKANLTKAECQTLMLFLTPTSECRDSRKESTQQEVGSEDGVVWAWDLRKASD